MPKTSHARPMRDCPTVVDQQSIAELRGMGPKSEAMLAAAGIKTVAQLKQLGSVRAYAMVKASGAKTSLNLLWAMEGALTGLPWQEVAREHRLSLLLALELHSSAA
jgi:DNA transformation protein